MFSDIGELVQKPPLGFGGKLDAIGLHQPSLRISRFLADETIALALPRTSLKSVPSPRSRDTSPSALDDIGAFCVELLKKCA
jgi:hypothetical protein